MKLKLFSICEGAFNNQGRLTIVNTYDMISASSFPLKMALGIAMTMAFSKDDGGKHMIVLHITNMKNEAEIAKMESEVTIPQDDNGGFLNFVSNVNGFVFPEAGDYNFDLTVDGTSIGGYVMKVKNSGNG